MSAADILHVRQGENYLVTDFTRTEGLRDDSAVMDILARISREIGFDRVRVWEQADGGRQALSIVPFAEWDNPYFSANTPGRIAALYCAAPRGQGASQGTDCGDRPIHPAGRKIQRSPIVPGCFHTPGRTPR